MKRLNILISSILILLFCYVSVNAEILYSGSCGENITYTVDENYNLVISGEGSMQEFENALDKNIPWYDYHSQITKVYIEEGVTSIGKAAFSRCSSLTNVVLPESLINISNKAFLYCRLLDNVTIPKHITTLSTYVFSDCTSLSTIRLYNNITSIEEYAFDNCTSLQTVYFYGTEEDWNNITIADGNDALLNANIVYIQEVQPTSISVSSKPLYIIGEDNDLDITVTVNNNDNTSTTLSPNDYTIETDFDSTTESEYTVKVIYGDFTDEVTVKVEPLTLTSISVITQPDTTSFTEGTDIDLSGMVVTGTYNNGTEAEITDYEVSGYDNSTVGNQTLTISYNDLTTTLPITVVQKSVTGINIISLPDKLYYNADETELDLTGLSVETLYNNGTVSENTSYTVSGFDGSVAGTQTITVTYGSFTDTFEVFVKLYEYKIDSNISKSYDFDTKALAVGTNITSRTDAGAVKVIVAVYDSTGALTGIKIDNVFFDANEEKDLTVNVEGVEYPFDTIKVFVWDFDIGKMLPMGLSV